ncbi:alpha/beta fold hydrolase [Nocardioides humi]|uniref:Alpha/beta hydrolase n=1 Tax=Nocardioides humi TaxID=449461 RepID=A0ABN2A8G7_9ACTN|nr:alpha/beta hydrolase [Nocardioides humi]
MTWTMADERLPELASWVSGDARDPVMVFVHPNPLDSWSWLYQVFEFAASHRCVAVDLPGYGATPPIPPEWTIEDLAAAVWRAVDRETRGGPAILVGCSIGSHLVEIMYHQRPEAVRALVVSGTGWDPHRHYIARRIREYAELGRAARRPHALDVLSRDFGSSDLGRFFVETTCRRGEHADPAAISRLFEIRAEVEPESFIAGIQAPALVVSGTEDAAHAGAAPLAERLPRGQMVALQGAGHACYLEQPVAFNAAMRSFLETL